MSSKQVTIKSVKPEGFKSYTSPVTFTFGVTGLHLIKGLNGVGKTSLFSALLWCLYKMNLNNTTNAKVATWKWVRPKGYKGTRVIVILGIGKYKYKIARHLSYTGLTSGLEGGNSLLIFKKEKMDKTPFNQTHLVNDELYKTDQQGYLNRLLGIDSRTFINSVVFGQRLERLMDSQDKDKRELFETLFEVDFIDGLKEKANTKLSEANTRILTLRGALQAATDKRDLLLGQKEEAERITSDFKADKKKRLEHIRASHEVKKEEYRKLLEAIKVAEKKAARKGETRVLDDLLQDADEKREALYDVKERRSNVNRDIADYQRQIASHNVTKSALWQKLGKTKDTCGTCGQPLNAKQVTAAKLAIEEEIKEEVATIRQLEHSCGQLEKSLENIEVEFEAANDAFTEALELYNDIKDANKGVNQIANVVGDLKQQAAIVKTEISSLVESFNTEKDRVAPKVNIGAIEAQLVIVEESIPDIERRIRGREKYVTRITWWIKTAFGSNGLKAFVFSAMLNRLNECLNTYTAYFGMKIEFGIDLSKQSKPFYSRISMDGTNDADYDEYSGGQKQKIDICVAFAMHDVVSVKSSFNLLIMDEAFEGLDYEAQEMVDTLLRIKAEKKAVYIVSHSAQMDLSGATEYEITGGTKGKPTIIA